MGGPLYYRITFYTTNNKEMSVDDPTYISHYDTIYKNLDKIQNNKPDLFKFENLRESDGKYLIKIYKFEPKYADEIISSIKNSNLQNVVRDYMLTILSDAKIKLNS